MVKRSAITTPEPTPSANSAKSAKSATPTSAASKPKVSTLYDREKGYLVQRVMDLAYKSLPYAELSRELGVPESRLKDQFKPNRANIRKTVEQLSS